MGDLDSELLEDIERQQREVCRRHDADFQPPPYDLKVGIAVGVREGVLPLNGLRHLPEGGTAGWYLWAGTVFSEEPDFFEPLHVAHLYEWNSPVLRYLALPPGWRFLVAGDHEDIWYDEALLSV